MATNPITNVQVPIPNGPAVHGIAITTSDTTTYSPPLRMIWVGGTGAVAVLLNGDQSAVTLTAVPAGSMLNVSAVKVMSTNTTATNMVGLW